VEVRSVVLPACFDEHPDDDPEEPREFQSGTDFPRGLRRELGPGTTRREVDSMPDGQHVIGVMTEAAVAPTVQINIVENWAEELKRRVPTP
jgi:hypothetical protein